MPRPPFPLSYTEILSCLYTFKHSPDIIPDPTILSLLYLTHPRDLNYNIDIIYKGKNIPDYKNIFLEYLTTHMKYYCYDKDVFYSVYEADNKKGLVLVFINDDYKNFIPLELLNEFQSYNENIKIKINKQKIKLNLIKQENISDNLMIENKPPSSNEDLFKAKKDTPKKKRAIQNSFAITSSLNDDFLETDNSLSTPRKKARLPERNKYLSITGSFKTLKIEQLSTIHNTSLRFQPVGTHNVSKISNRVANNVKNPLKLTFVKFHDQIRAPLFKTVEKARERISYKKISLVQDYNVDSDEEWIIEDGDSIDNSEITSSEETQIADFDWIDREDGDTVKNVYKKPEICRVDIGFIKYHENFDIENYKCIKLKRDDNLNEEFLEKFKAKILAAKNKDDCIKMFGSEYRISNGTLRAKMKEFYKNARENVDITN